MSLIEQRIHELEMRPAGFDSAEQETRVSMIQHYSAICKFEGIIPSEIDKRLFALLTSGRVTKEEYRDFCLDYAITAVT